MGISLEKINKWGEKKKTKKLLGVLNNDNTETRAHAIRALAFGEDPGIINKLVNFLRDPAPDVRLATLETLGKIDTGKSKEFIRFMLEKEEDEKLISAAKDALTAIKEKSEEKEDIA